MTARRVATLPFALAALFLVAGCDPAAQAQASRQFQHQGDVFGYHAYHRLTPGGGDFTWAQGEPVITIYTRNGAPVGEGDRAAARAAAAELCRLEGGIEFNRRARGVFLSRGGLSFAGDCRTW